MNTKCSRGVEMLFHFSHSDVFMCINIGNNIMCTCTVERVNHNLYYLRYYVPTLRIPQLIVEEYTL